MICLDENDKNKIIQDNTGNGDNSHISLQFIWAKALNHHTLWQSNFHYAEPIIFKHLLLT